MANPDIELDLDATQVSVAVTGAISYGDVSTLMESPNPASVPLPAGVKQVGYLTEDGVTVAKEADETELFAWQNNAKVRIMRSQGSLVFTITMMENRKENRELWFGGVETDGVIKIRPDAQINTGVVIDVFDNSDEVGAMYHSRYVIERAQIAGTGEITYISTDAIKYEVTITALADRNGDSAILETRTIEVETP